MNCDLCRMETRWPALGFVNPGPSPLPLSFRIQPKFVCEDCALGSFHYLISAVGMTRDGYRDWLNHMAHKDWFSPRCVEALQKFARLLRSMPQREPITGFVKGARNIPHAVRSRVMERDNFSCRRCGAGPEESRLEVDHVNPVTRGGTAVFQNLQTLCHSCNQGKRGHPPHPHDLAII